MHNEEKGKRALQLHTVRLAVECVTLLTAPYFKLPLLDALRSSNPAQPYVLCQHRRASCGVWGGGGGEARGAQCSPPATEIL